MIAVSDAWKNLNQRFLLPETFVEISSAITEVGAQEEATATGTNEAVFSDVDSVLGVAGERKISKYATLEPNLWALDGTRNIFPGDGAHNTGYASNIAESGSVTLKMDRVHDYALPGVTIDWSSEYGEYPLVFTVTAKNGDEVVAETTVTDNTSNRSLVYMNIENYDSIVVTIHNWCIPNRRARIDAVKLGMHLTFTKSDVLSYSHEQFGSLVSAELPKNSIDFSLDNSDNRWNPSNPAGLEQYLSERQRLTVRYGLDVDGTTEWIKAGTFYLSEWKTPANGLEASFSARDVLEYMINELYTGRTSGTLWEIANDAVAQIDVPQGMNVAFSEVLKNYSGTLTGEHTVAEVLQMCANAGCCVMYQDREGVLRIEPLVANQTEYAVPLELAYAWPEIELSKKLKGVSVSWGDGNTYDLHVGDSGETQTVNNQLINSEERAAAVAEWVKSVLETRKTISGEYRADPRLDLFDAIGVDSRFGNISPVVVSDVKYTYSGSFRGSYVGRVGGA